jgi:putative glutamine amidotransferase
MNCLRLAGADPLSTYSFPLLEETFLGEAVTDAVFDELFDRIWSYLCQMNVSGLLLAGGEDLSSHWYGQNPHPQNTQNDLWRDVWERFLLLMAWQLKLPTFGICRGMQHMHVALGGSLIQNLPDYWSSHHGDLPALQHGPGQAATTPANFLRHLITVDSASRFGTLIRSDAPSARFFLLEVLSQHHQTIGDVLPDWSISARACDRVIEVIEVAQQPFWLGTQFHPEWQFDTGWSQRLFAGFVRVCREYEPVPQLESLRPAVHSFVAAHFSPVLGKDL